MSMSRGTDVERSTYVERGEPLSKLQAGFFFLGIDIAARYALQLSL